MIFYTFIWACLCVLVGVVCYNCGRHEQKTIDGLAMANIIKGKEK